VFARVLPHFRQLVPRKPYEDYDRDDPFVGILKPPRGFSDAGHFRLGID